MSRNFKIPAMMAYQPANYSVPVFQAMRSDLLAAEKKMGEVEGELMKVQEQLLIEKRKTVDIQRQSDLHQSDRQNRETEIHKLKIENTGLKADLTTLRVRLEAGKKAVQDAEEMKQNYVRDIQRLKKAKETSERDSRKEKRLVQMDLTNATRSQKTAEEELKRARKEVSDVKKKLADHPTFWAGCIDITIDE